MSGYDDWLEQPRVDADNARAREEAIDEWLGEEFDRRLQSLPGAGAVMAQLDSDDEWPAIIAHATTRRSRHTVETAVAAMLDAARQAWVRDTDNRQRAAQCIAEAKVRSGDNG